MGRNRRPSERERRETRRQAARLVAAAAPEVEAWIAPALLNGWVNHGSGFETAAFYRDPFGRVFWRGLVKNGSGSANIFVLPEGYRPALDEVFVTIGNGVLGRVDVQANGGVRHQIGGGAYFSLSGISFRAAQ